MPPPTPPTTPTTPRIAAHAGSTETSAAWEQEADTESFSTDTDDGWTRASEPFTSHRLLYDRTDPQHRVIVEREHAFSLSTLRGMQAIFKERALALEEEVAALSREVATQKEARAAADERAAAALAQAQAADVRAAAAEARAVAAERLAAVEAGASKAASDRVAKAEPRVAQLEGENAALREAAKQAELQRTILRRLFGRDADLEGLEQAGNTTSEAVSSEPGAGEAEAPEIGTQAGESVGRASPSVAQQLHERFYGTRSPTRDGTRSAGVRDVARSPATRAGPSTRVRARDFL